MRCCCTAPLTHLAAWIAGVACAYCPQLVGDNFHADFVVDATVTPVDVAIPINVTDGLPARCEQITEISALGDTLNGHHGVEAMRRLRARKLGQWSVSSTSTSTSSTTSSTTTTVSFSGVVAMKSMTVAKVPCIFVGGIGYEYVAVCA